MTHHPKTLQARNENLQATLLELVESLESWAELTTQIQKDAARYQKLATYLVSNDTALDDAINGASTVEELRGVIDGAMKGTP